MFDLGSSECTLSPDVMLLLTSDEVVMFLLGLASGRNITTQHQHRVRVALHRYCHTQVLLKSRIIDWNLAARYNREVMDHMPYYDVTLPKPRTHLCDTAARYGSMEALQTLVFQGYPVTRSTEIQAVRYGQLEILKWLALHNLQRHDAECVTYAARYNQLDIIEWFPLSVVSRLSYNIQHAAAMHGHLAIFKWCESRFFERSVRVTQTLVDTGNLKLLIWCVSRGYPIDIPACLTSALKSNCRDIIDYLVTLASDSSG
jgi:hypothetical protein